MFSIVYKRGEKEGGSNEGRTTIQRMLSSYNTLSITLSGRDEVVYKTNGLSVQRCWTLVKRP